MFLEFSGFYILSNLQLSRFIVYLVASAATLIYYHIYQILSTTFLTFFDFCFQPNGFPQSSVAVVFCPAGINYTITVVYCQQLFKTFFHLTNKSEKNNHLENGAEKEGFEPSRRFPDLHP